jgi:hypothetical protein
MVDRTRLAIWRFGTLFRPTIDGQVFRQSTIFACIYGLITTLSLQE